MRVAEQTDFSEPMARINRDLIDAAAYGWDEAKAWDALAGYYRQRGLAATGPEIHGNVDEVTVAHVSGWLTSREAGRPRYARVWVDGVERGAVRADLWRPDLATRKISDGFSGFRFVFSGGLDPYADRQVRVEDRETGRSLSAAPLVLRALVGAPDSPFAGEADFSVLNVGSATYEGERLRVQLEVFGAAAAAPLHSPDADVETVEVTPVRHPYLDAVRLPAARMNVLLRPRDAMRPIALHAQGEGLDPLLCGALVPARLPDYVGALSAENMSRVSGEGEQGGRFAATGLATAHRLEGLARRHFGRGLGEGGPASIGARARAGWRCRSSASSRRRST